MLVAAVPMAGKTTLLALLALIAISEVHNSGLNGPTGSSGLSYGSSLFQRGYGTVGHGNPILGSPSYSELGSTYGHHSGSGLSSTYSSSGTYSTSNIDRIVRDLENQRILEKCKSRPHEFVLVVDESGSITQDHWIRDVLEFVKIVAKALETSNTGNKLAIVQFSHTPKLIMDLTNFASSNLDTIYRTIEDMFFLGRRTYGATYTGAALKFARERVLDKDGRFVVDITEKTFSQNKRDQVLILLTDGAANDYSVAVKESLIARFNGVHVMVFGIGLVNNLECRKLVGCSQYGACPDSIKASWRNLFNYVTDLFRKACDTSVRNAVCLEKWEPYGECSKPCGGGIQYAKFLEAVTVSQPTTFGGTTGLTCQQQYVGIANKFKSCNIHPCVDTVPTDIQRHVQRSQTSDESESSIGSTSALNTLLRTAGYGTSTSETYSESPSSDSDLHSGHSELGSSDGHFDFGRYGSRSYDEEREDEAEEEEEELDDEDRHSFDNDHEEEELNDEEEHDFYSDHEEEGEVEHDEEYSGGYVEHDEDYLAQPEAPSSDNLETEDTETEELKTSEQDESDESGHSYTRFIGSNRLRVVAVAATVVILTAISITAFSYLFLKGKGRAPLMPDPSDLEFMNAGDGDDVEPSENFQVSNADDGIWA